MNAKETDRRITRWHFLSLSQSELRFLSFFLLRPLRSPRWQWMSRHETDKIEKRKGKSRCSLLIIRTLRKWWTAGAAEQDGECWATGRCGASACECTDSRELFCIEIWTEATGDGYCVDVLFIASRGTRRFCFRFVLQINKPFMTGAADCLSEAEGDRICVPFVWFSCGITCHSFIVFNLRSSLHSDEFNDKFSPALLRSAPTIYRKWINFPFRTRAAAPIFVCQWEMGEKKEISSVDMKMLLLAPLGLDVEERWARACVRFFLFCPPARHSTSYRMFGNARKATKARVQLPVNVDCRHWPWA